jgi:hypothetical protein
VAQEIGGALSNAGAPAVGPGERTLGRRVPLALIALLIALPRIPILMAGPGAHLSLMVDDASYYLEAARRSALTHAWPSMDGIAPTNGFHPLYMAVVIVIQALAGTDPEVVLPLVMLLNLALNGLAVWLLVRSIVLRRIEVPGVLAAAMLAVDPGWIPHGTLGVENSLSSLLLLLAALQWQDRYGGEHTPHGRRFGWAAGGALLGLAILGRTDSCIFALAYLAGAVWSLIRTHGLRVACAEAAGVALVAALVVAPWAVTNLVMFGTLVQDSGAALAVRFANEYGPRTSAASLEVMPKLLGFWAYRLMWAGGLLPLTGWLLGLAVPMRRTRGLARIGAAGWCVAGLCAASLLLRANSPTDIRDPRIAALEMGLATLAFLAGLVSDRLEGWRFRPIYAVVSASALLTVAAYVLVFRGFQVWYSTGPCLIFIVLVAASVLPAALAGRRALAGTLLVAMTLQSITVVSRLITRDGIEAMERGILDRGAAMRTRLQHFIARSPAPVRFGCFDSGELSYLLHPVPVVNTDGVMNHEASLAIRHGTIGRYLRSAGITHLFADSTRIRQYHRVGDFPATYDPASSADIGLIVWRLDWGGTPVDDSLRSRPVNGRRPRP